MKYSQFNSILPFDGKYALYNSFEQKVIFLDIDLKELLEAGILDGILELKNIHPEFYEYLLLHKFLVEKEIDEVEIVKNLSKGIDEDDSIFILTINPTMNCNFKCYYCYETHIKKSKLENIDSEKIIKFISLISSNEKIKTFNLSFFGGEPLLYFEKNVIPIIDHFVASCRANRKQFQISFTTNAYLINSNFVKYFKANGISCFLQITLDGYREEHDKVRYVSKTRGSYFEIIDNIKLLVTNKLDVLIRVNYTDENLVNVEKIPLEFNDLDQVIKDNHLSFSFHRVWQNEKIDDTHLVVEEKIYEIKELGIKAGDSYSPDNVKYSCYADKRNSVVIYYNGDLYKCTARDFETKNREGYISEDGELIWENDSLNNRMNSKFNNKPCLTCRIMPLCNGGCSQHALEHLKSGKEYCIYEGVESEKDIVVRTKIKAILDAIPQEA